MTDRGKVVSAYECVITRGKSVCECGKCDYHIKDSAVFFCDNQRILTDVLAMLKEHEAVEPTLIREGRNKYYNDYVCPRCDNEVVYEQNYCSECGVPFLWEGDSG